MKNILAKIVLFSVIFFGAHWSASAQIYVRIRPAVPVVIQPVRPGPAHVWIREEWDEDGHGYRYSGGHWDAPPHPGDRWNRGHWNHDRNHGDKWVHGSWGGRRR